MKRFNRYDRELFKFVVFLLVVPAVVLGLVVLFRKLKGG